MHLSKCMSMANLRDTVLSLPQQWLSGTPWSCRTCTVSLQASGQHPGLTFCTDPLPPARGETRKRGSPSSLGLLPHQNQLGPGWCCNKTLCPRAPSCREHLQPQPYSCHTPKTCVLAPSAGSQISLESAGKATRKNTTFL